MSDAGGDGAFRDGQGFPERQTHRIGADEVAFAFHAEAVERHAASIDEDLLAQRLVVRGHDDANVLRAVGTDRVERGHDTEQRDDCNCCPETSCDSFHKSASRVGMIVRRAIRRLRSNGLRCN
jgi:hypothetical protein